MEVRKGDVLRLKPVTVDSVYSDGTFDVEETALCEGTTYFVTDMVEEIISRIETPEETKERLESEVSFWKASSEFYHAEMLRMHDLLAGASDGQK